MAAKKAADLVSDFESTEPEEDVIVLKKSLVVNIGVAVVFFLAGALTMYVLGVLPAIASKTLAEAQARAQAQQPSGGAQVIQPTEPPARLSNVNVGTLPPLGSPNAPIKIVEFSDFQCPYCKTWTDNTLQPLREKYGDKIVIYYRHFPLTSIHPEALNGAVAAECANEQGKFWEMHYELFSTQTLISVANSTSLASDLGLDAEKFDKCMSSNPYQANIDADMTDADAYGVTGTPTFFINGVRLVGAQPLARFTAVIDEELN